MGKPVFTSIHYMHTAGRPVFTSTGDTFRKHPTKYSNSSTQIIETLPNFKPIQNVILNRKDMVTIIYVYKTGCLCRPTQLWVNYILR